MDHPESISQAAQNGQAVPPQQPLNPNDFKETKQYQASSAPEPSLFNETPQPTQPAQPSPDDASTGSVLKSLENKGYDVSQFENDEDLINETEARYAAAMQAQEDLKAHEQYMAQQQQQELQARKQAELLHQQQTQPAQEPVNETGKPDYDPSWASLVEQDESGQFVVRDEYIGTVDPSVAEKVNKYVTWRQERSNELIENPVQAVMQAGLEQEIQQRVNQAVGSALNKNRTLSDAQEFIAQNAPVLYVTNPKTGKFETDRNGQPLLSPAGKALNDAHVYLREQGMGDPVSRHQVAMQMIAPQLQAIANNMQQQQPQQPQQDAFKDAYTDQPFAEPTNPAPMGTMPNMQVNPNANASLANGLPEHNSLGSLATQLAVHKGYLQPK